MPEKKMSVDQFAEFSSAVMRSLPRDLPSELQQAYITDQSRLAVALRNGLVPTSVVVEPAAASKPAPIEPTAPAPQPDYFIPVLDADIPNKHKAIGAKYRCLATEQGCATHPVCYRVRAGFTLKTHAPLAGPCRNNFQYLQGWNFQDEATRDSYVFWVPGILRGSTSKNVNQQMELLSATRAKSNLPAHHMSNFGSVALAAGLILAHFKATGERISLVVRTGTCDSVGYRLGLDWRDGELYCDYWYYDGEPYDRVGVLALGVELGN